MYEIKTRVRLSEVSADGCMTLPGIINTFQDASIFQSEDLGVGTKYLEEHKKAGRSTTLPETGGNRQHIYMGQWISWIFWRPEFYYAG